MKFVPESTISTQKEKRTNYRNLKVGLKTRFVFRGITVTISTKAYAIRNGVDHSVPQLDGRS